MQKTAYADMHCDTVTVCCDAGGNLADFGGQTNVEKLIKSGCAAQCFALFTEGENAAGDFERYSAFYSAQIAKDPRILPVERFCDIEKARGQGLLAAILTVENLGFTGGDPQKISALSKSGVKMASLVWNTPNALAFPNLCWDGKSAPDLRAREKRGLTKAGRLAVEILNEENIIIDLSHLSDGGVEDILNLSTAPVVASHSNCRAECDVSRNLTDSQLKKIADKGGVVGLNYCRDFILCGAENVFEKLYRHYIHMVNTGGEDLPALGSDFDGIPAYPELSDCTAVQRLLEYFSERGVPSRRLEKLAFGNFARTFKEVVG